jgi:hypothetical protein
MQGLALPHQNHQNFASSSSQSPSGSSIRQDTPRRPRPPYPSNYGRESDRDLDEADDIADDDILGPAILEKRLRAEDDGEGSEDEEGEGDVGGGVGTGGVKKDDEGVELGRLTKRRKGEQ